MKAALAKILLIGAVLQVSYASAQFHWKDRKDNLEDFDEAKYTWGFFLNGNHFDYKMVLDAEKGLDEQGRNMVLSKGKYSFGAGLIGKMRLSDNFDLRLEPGLQFVEREITFNTQRNDRFANDPENPFTPRALTPADTLRDVKSTYIDIPLLLEYHGERWYNSRPYIAAGFNWLINLQSMSNSPEDNSAGVFRSTTNNFAWSPEVGIQFYFNRFKLTPAFRGTFVMNSELVADNPDTPPYWTAAIETMHTRALMFILKFE